MQHFARGHDRAPRPCTYCNKCLVNVVENPLGCYEESRFDSREAMVRQIMSVYEPRQFAGKRNARQFRRAKTLKLRGPDWGSLNARLEAESLS